MFKWLEQNPYYASERIFDNQKGEMDGYDWVKYHELKFENPSDNGELLLYISEIPVCIQWSFVNKNMFIQSTVCHHDNGPQWMRELLDEVYKKHDEHLKEQGLELLAVLPIRGFDIISEPDIVDVFSKGFVADATISKEEKIQEFKRTPIECLTLSQRPLVQLKKSGVLTVGQLLLYPPEEFKNIERLGVRSIDEILECVYKLKRQFNM